MDNGTVYLDHTVRFDDQNEAMQFGVDNAQQAIYDANTGAVLPVVPPFTVPGQQLPMPHTASEEEPGLLWRAPGDNGTHDYSPYWDKEVDEEPDPEMAKMVAQHAQGIYDKTDRLRLRCGPCITPEDRVAEFASGTGSWPVVMMDLERHRGYEDQLHQSLQHELMHGRQEFEGRDMDEDEAENWHEARTSSATPNKFVTTKEQHLRSLKIHGPVKPHHHAN